MTVLWQLFLTIGTAAAFNPMELYLNSTQGVSFAFVVDGVKQYSYFWWQGHGSLSIAMHWSRLQEFGQKSYTRMKVTERLNAGSDEFMIQSQASALHVVLALRQDQSPTSRSVLWT